MWCFVAMGGRAFFDDDDRFYFGELPRGNRGNLLKQGRLWPGWCENQKIRQNTLLERSESRASTRELAP